MKQTEIILCKHALEELIITHHKVNEVLLSGKFQLSSTVANIQKSIDSLSAILEAEE